jgi:hypothetical protein
MKIGPEPGIRFFQPLALILLFIFLPPKASPKIKTRLHRLRRSRLHPIPLLHLISVRHPILLPRHVPLPHNIQQAAMAMMESRVEHLPATQEERLAPMAERRRETPQVVIGRMLAVQQTTGRTRVQMPVPTGRPEAQQARIAQIPIQTIEPTPLERRTAERPPIPPPSAPSRRMRQGAIPARIQR